jgi:hypothetical protein
VPGFFVFVWFYATAQAASAAEHAQFQSAARDEDEHLKSALVESAIEDEAFAE